MTTEQLLARDRMVAHVHFLADHYGLSVASRFEDDLYLLLGADLPQRMAANDWADIDGPHSIPHLEGITCATLRCRRRPED